MYVPHRDFKTPADRVNLWRYMDVARFIDLVLSKTLYFPSVSELFKLDQWEGHRCRDLQSFFSVVSCWHKNDIESVAMWRLYTSGLEGVAIKTTIGRLKKALAAERCEITIGDVQYGIAALDTTSEVALLLCKRPNYVHEQEVRAIIVKPPPERNEPIFGQAMAKRLFRQNGYLVSVEVLALIEEIVVSPSFPEWALKSLNRVISDSGLSVQANLSDLREPC